MNRPLQTSLQVAILGNYRGRNILGIAYYVIRQLLINILIYGLELVSFSRDAFRHQLDIILLFGFILGRKKFKD